MIYYRVGDATRPVGSGKKILMHITNNCRAWGAGFVLAISRRWLAPEVHYRANHQVLGNVQFVDVGDDIVIANMCAQAGFGSRGTPPIRYDALRTCLGKVQAEAVRIGASVHAPRIGCGLSGSNWSLIEPIVAEQLVGVDVNIYDLPKETS